MALSPHGRRRHALAPGLPLLLPLTALAALFALPSSPRRARGQAWVGTRSPQGLRQPWQPDALVARAAGGADEGDERLRGAWRYSKGAYDILEEDGKLYFQELQLKGELQPEGEWLVATLPGAGTIRLKLHGAGDSVLSNFKVPDSQEWGEDVVAVPEWSSLSAKASDLESQLDALEFTGTAADGAVVVTVDGRQRPKGVQLSDSASIADLGPLVKEAYTSAAQASLMDATEKLRELYAGHFGMTAPAAAAAPAPAPA